MSVQSQHEQYTAQCLEHMMVCPQRPPHCARDLRTSVGAPLAHPTAKVAHTTTLNSRGLSVLLVRQHSHVLAAASILW